MKHWWLWRAFHGGLWIKFSNNTWERCSWVKTHPGYINNHHTGGQFHKTFVDIEQIQDFPYQLVKNPIAKPAEPK